MIMQCLSSGASKLLALTQLFSFLICFLSVFLHFKLKIKQN